MMPILVSRGIYDKYIQEGHLEILIHCQNQSIYCKVGNIHDENNKKHTEEIFYGYH